MAESSVGSAEGHLPYDPTVPRSHRAGPCGPGGAPYGRPEYGRSRRRSDAIPGTGKGLKETGPDPDYRTTARYFTMVSGLLHPWENKDCSLYTNALFYSPVRPSQAVPWPSPTDRAPRAMRPSHMSDRYVRYVRYVTLRALYAPRRPLAMHGVCGARLTTARTA